MGRRRSSSPETKENEDILRFIRKMSNSSNPFAMMYKSASEYEKALARGDTDLSNFDFAVMPQCSLCAKPASKIQLCSRCQACLYCSKECQVKDWKVPRGFGAPVHKTLCPRNVEHMKRKPELIARVKLFPFLKIESDDTTSHEIAMARLGVLGGSLEFGYWARAGGITPHDMVRAKIAPKNTYEHGRMLLLPSWGDHEKYWKLHNRAWIPELEFEDRESTPGDPRGVVKDWPSWYAWRGLPMESPACLLMDAPLSVYFLLTEVLGVVKTRKVELLGPPKKLELHLLGVETELNLIPLFSELALLCPNTQITMTIFGSPIPRIIKEAESIPGVLASKHTGKADDVIWSYTAPEKTGAGRIDIKLCPDGLWTRQVAQTLPGPDVIIVLNAGLGAYDTWNEVISCAFVTGTPMGVTEYAEQSLKVNITGFPMILDHIIPQMAAFPDVLELLQKRRGQVGHEKVLVNPWGRPGQRSVGQTRVPNFYNGFGLAVNRIAP